MQFGGEMKFKSFNLKIGSLITIIKLTGVITNKKYYICTL